MAWRDSKGGRKRLLLFLSAMVVGVSALVAILSLGYSLERTIDEDAASLLGGNLVIKSTKPFWPELESLIDSVGGVQARRVSFLAQARFSGQKAGGVVRVRAMETQFPLYGELVISPPGAELAMREGRGVLVARGALSDAPVEPGDSVIIRGRTFEVAGILIGSRIESVFDMMFRPPVYMSLAELDSLQSSVASYEVFFRFERDIDLVALQTAIQDSFQVTVRTEEDEKEAWDTALGLLERFLGLVGFFALILGGLGVGSVLQVHLKERHDTVAVLRCLGASSGRVASIYLAQAAGLGVIVGAAACVVGTLGQVLLPLGIADLIPVDINYHVSPAGLLAGFGLGVGATLVFALLPLSGLRNVSPLAALRSAYGRRRLRKSRLGVYALIGLGIGICAFMQTGRVVATVLYVVAIGVIFGLLGLTASAFIKLMRTIAPRVRNYAWRQGLSNMHRPDNQTLLMVVALGLGTVMIMTLVLVESAVTERVSSLSQLEESVPDLVVPAVSSEDLEGFRSIIAAYDLDIQGEVAMLTVIVDTIPKHPAPDSLTEERLSAYNRPHMATFVTRGMDTLQVLEGTFVHAWHDSLTAVPVALSRYYAQEVFDVTVGDTVVFDVYGARVVTVVGSIFSSISSNTALNMRGPRLIIFPRGIMESLPHTRTFLLTSDDTQSLSAVHDIIREQYPDISVIYLPFVLGIVQEVFRRISYMTRFMSLFCVAAGVMVLAGAVMVSRQARLEQTVLLKTLGASKRQVYTVMCVEYLCLGLLATVTGLGLAMVAAWILTGFQFDIVFTVPEVSIIIAVVALTGLTVGIGLLNSRGIYARPPLEVLRAEV